MSDVFNSWLLHLWNESRALDCEFSLQSSGYARGWNSLSNCERLPSSETVNLMLQYKYILMFWFALCSRRHVSSQLLASQTTWPLTLLSNVSSLVHTSSHPVITSLLCRLTLFSICCDAQKLKRVSVWCLSKPGKSAIILITAAALLSCFTVFLTVPTCFFI